jgi:hypothetical protein
MSEQGVDNFLMNNQEIEELPKEDFSFHGLPFLIQRKQMKLYQESVKP